MSATLIIWLLLFVGLTLAAFKRSVYAVAVYMLTFFLCPPFWWWGDPIGSIRWSLYSGLILLAAVLFSRGQQISSLNAEGRRVLKIALLMVLNATLVNYTLAADLESSTESFLLLAKFMLLLYLLYASIKDREDLKIAMISILLGAAYIGFEVTINERGEINSNRLEGVGAPGASTANHFACLMVVILPMLAPFFLVGKTWQRVVAVLIAPFILNVVLLCNSRGAFLAAIVSAVVFLMSAPKIIRRKAIVVVAFGALGTFMLMGDVRIMDRFLTTFSAAEERDSSAQSRFEFAKAGLAMIGDHPLGSGGSAFKKVRGLKYLQQLGISDVFKAMHNGYLTEMCSWGIQGGILRYALFFVAILATWRMLRANRDPSPERVFDSLAACAFLSGTAALLVSSCFGDHLDSEWGVWMIALMLVCIVIAEKDRNQELDENFEDDDLVLDEQFDVV